LTTEADHYNNNNNNNMA